MVSDSSEFGAKMPISQSGPLHSPSELSVSRPEALTQETNANDLCGRVGCGHADTYMNILPFTFTL
jgi:hypothetical protein